MKQLKITVGSKSYDVTVEVVGESAPVATSIVAASTAAPVAAPVKAAAAPVALAGSGDIASPMAGVVFKLVATAGATVVAGDTLVILEAMKMETPVLAPANGTITCINVKEGDSVQEGQVMITMS